MIYFLLLAFLGAPAPGRVYDSSDRVSVLASVASYIADSDSAACSEAFCGTPAVIIVVSAADSAAFPVVSRFPTVTPMTIQRLDQIEPPHRALYVSGLHLEADSASLVIEDIVITNVLPRHRPPPVPESARYRYSGHFWMFICQKTDGVWRVRRAMEGIS